MARGYRRLSAADEDEIWLMLRAGHAAKPTARALGWSTSGVRVTWSGAAGPARLSGVVRWVG
jgi:hypothetical protein